MKRFSFDSEFAMALVLCVVLFLNLGVAIVTAQIKSYERIEQRENEAAKRDAMLSAEKECFDQAAQLYEELSEVPEAKELISERTWSKLGEFNEYTLEFYKAAIEDMSQVEGYADRFDDCDYLISLKNAVDAERAYELSVNGVNK